MSEITWDYLSVRQQETLQDIVLGNGAVVYDPQMKGLCNWLNGHGLVVILPNPHTPGRIMVDPTDKGREVYAQKPPAAETGARGDVSPSAFAQAAQGDNSLAVAMYEAAVLDTVANEFHQEVLALREQLAAAQAVNTRLANALEPFAEAWLQVPYGHGRSLLMIGVVGDAYGHQTLSATTSDLEDAHTAYFGLPEASGGEGAE